MRNEMSSSSKSNNGLAKQDKKKSKTLRSKHTKMIIRSDKARIRAKRETKPNNQSLKKQKV